MYILLIQEYSTDKKFASQSSSQDLKLPNIFKTHSCSKFNITQFWAENSTSITKLSKRYSLKKQSGL